MTNTLYSDVVHIASNTLQTLGRGAHYSHLWRCLFMPSNFRHPFSRQL